MQPVHVYARSWRLVAACLFALSRANLPAMVFAIVFSQVPINPPAFYRTVVVFSLLPALGASTIARVLRGVLTVDARGARIARAGLAIDVPASVIAGVRPWRVPLPGPGFALVTTDGRRLPYGLQTRDPTPALVALCDVAGVAAARTALRHPAIVYARAKAAAGAWRWRDLALKFPLFALAPTAVLFNAHQHIAYGGTFGEYYLLGLGPYLQTLAIYWVTTTIYCVLWASVWRGPAEGASLLAAHVAPSRAARVRRAAEIACRVLYYAGVPVLLALRFFAG